jgi:organic hydroperoxide reductase OsmC/OhrA
MNVRRAFGGEVATMTQPFPHTYEATASAEPAGAVAVVSPGLEPLSTAPPAEFGGPGSLWSPETLLVASIANCFVLTLRALSRAAGFRWVGIECRVEGVLERVAGVTQFSRFVTYATLTVPHGGDEAAARRMLERAEHGCLIANSLRGTRRLESTIVVSEASMAAREAAVRT